MDGAHKFQASFDWFNGMDLSGSDDPWGLQSLQHFLRYPAAPAPFGGEPAGLEAYLCNQPERFSVGDFSLQQLLGVHAPAELLSDKVTAAFPSLADRFQVEGFPAGPPSALARPLLPGWSAQVRRAAPWLSSSPGTG